MLYGIPHLISPALLAILQEMGHGDRIAIVDGNYPGASAGPKLVRLDGHSATDVLDAILKLMPLDQFVPEAAFCPKVTANDGKRPPIHDDFAQIVENRSPGFKLIPLEPASFYAKANSSYAMIQTSEQRLYGNIILSKGVIEPD